VACGPVAPAHRSGAAAVELPGLVAHYQTEPRTCRSTRRRSNISGRPADRNHGRRRVWKSRICQNLRMEAVTEEAAPISMLDDFIDHLKHIWPDRLRELGMMERRSRVRLASTRWLRIWAETPPDYPVIRGAVDAAR